MIWRSTALAALVIGLAAPLPAAAQYYPSNTGYRWGPPPSPPPGAFPDDDDDDPVIYTRRPSRGYLDQPTYGRAAPEAVDARPLPAPGEPGRPDIAAVEEFRPLPGHRPSEAGPDALRAMPEYRPSDPPPVIYSGRPAEPFQPGYTVPSDPNAMRPPVDVRQAAPSAPLSPRGGDVVGTVPQQQQPPNSVMMLPPEDQPEQGAPKELPPNLKRQVVDYTAKDPAGTIVVDTANTYLYFVMGGGKAMRYGIGVGREGFTWAGREKISRKTEWPDWHPPEQMIERQPYLPRFMAGGPGNPMGARALYLGKTLFRIHGTNQPSTIGQFVSSGCIRLLNEDIEDLYERVKVGTQVVVLPGKPATPVAARQPARAAEAVPQSPPPVITAR